MSARGTTGMRLARASITSGLSDFTALEITTTSTAATCARSWPSITRAPSATSRSVVALADKSEPLIWYP